MSRTLSEEEQKLTLEKLESELIATRYMTLKSLNYSISQDKVDLAKMNSEAPTFTKTLFRKIEFMAGNEKVDMVKREAGLCFEAIQKKMTIIQSQDGACLSCGERLIVTFKFCTKCGTEFKGAVAKQCEKCKSPADPKWNNCPNCGNQLIKKEVVPEVCPSCKNKVDPKWLVCPFCATKLR